jgi:hypothetical protein
VSTNGPRSMAMAVGAGTRSPSHCPQCGSRAYSGFPRKPWRSYFSPSIGQFKVVLVFLVLPVVPSHTAPPASCCSQSSAQSAASSWATYHSSGIAARPETVDVDATDSPTISVDTVFQGLSLPNPQGPPLNPPRHVTRSRTFINHISSAYLSAHSFTVSHFCIFAPLHAQNIRSLLDALCPVTL